MVPSFAPEPSGSSQNHRYQHECQYQYEHSLLLQNWQNNIVGIQPPSLRPGEDTPLQFVSSSASLTTTSKAKLRTNLPSAEQEQTQLQAQEPSITTPENLKNILHTDQSKLIHLDPVPQFKEKADIKTWLQKIFYPQGIEIVIERSDSTKVIFKCKASKRGKNAKEHVVSSQLVNSKANCVQQCIKLKKSKRSVSRFNICPFRIRATFSLKRQKWSIVVMNNVHSHDLEFNPDSEEYKKFKMKLRQDNDREAIRKFDELEYRKRANLPLVTPEIPCDCGLTSEIRSFDVVLPTSIQFTGGINNNLDWNLGESLFVGQSLGQCSGNSSKKVTKKTNNNNKNNNNGKLRQLQIPKRITKSNTMSGNSVKKFMLPEFLRSSDFEIGIGSSAQSNTSTSFGQQQPEFRKGESLSGGTDNVGGCGGGAVITTGSTIAPQDINLNEIDFTEMFLDLTRHHNNRGRTRAHSNVDKRSRSRDYHHLNAGSGNSESNGSKSHKETSESNGNGKPLVKDTVDLDFDFNLDLGHGHGNTQPDFCVVQEFDPLLMDGLQAQPKSIELTQIYDSRSRDDGTDDRDSDLLNPSIVQFSSGSSADSLGSIDTPFNITGTTMPSSLEDIVVKEPNFETVKLPILGATFETDTEDFIRFSRDQASQIQSEEGQQSREEFVYSGFDTVKSETPDPLASWLQIFK